MSGVRSKCVLYLLIPPRVTALELLPWHLEEKMDHSIEIFCLGYFTQVVFYCREKEKLEKI